MDDNPMIYLRSTTANSHMTLARQLREFATVATAVLKFALPGDTQKYFMASTKPPNRVAPYGYYNRTAHTSAHIFLTRAVQTKLHLVMLALKAHLTREQHVAFTAGHLQVKTQKFAGHHLYHGGPAIIHLASQMRSELSACKSSYAQEPLQ